MNKEQNKQNSTDNACYTLSPTVLDEMIEYIEEAVETVDGEWGSSRSFEQLKKDGCMPELYHKLITLRNGG